MHLARRAKFSTFRLSLAAALMLAVYTFMTRRRGM